MEARSLLSVDDKPDDVVTQALAAAKKADEMRGAAIKELLARQEQITRDLKSLGYTPTEQNGLQNGRAIRSAPRTTAQAVTDRNAGRRFRDMTLSQVVKLLLEENEVLHGKQIETLAKTGGFERGTKNFQNYLPVALKRAGGFENVGGNRWRINESIQPQEQ